MTTLRRYPPARPPACSCSPGQQWDERDHVDGNYARAGLVADVNAAFGRNARRDVLREKAEADPEALDAAEPDDELKAACAQVLALQGRGGRRAEGWLAGGGAGSWRAGAVHQQGDLGQAEGGREHFGGAPREACLEPCMLCLTA